VSELNWIKPPWKEDKTEWDWPKEGDALLMAIEVAHGRISYYLGEYCPPYQHINSIAIARIPEPPKEMT
jgi:hypothetical protein